MYASQMLLLEKKSMFVVRTKWSEKKTCC